MTTRPGFALLTVLWIIVALSVLILGTVPPIARAARAQDNAGQLVRARWAALGCIELLKAQASTGRGASVADSIALAPTVWCTVQTVRPDERINPNVADSAGLLRVLGNATRVASLLDWIDSDDQPRDAGAEAEWYRRRARPLPRNGRLASPSELSLVRGFEGVTSDELEAMFTLHGDGRVSPARAPDWALRSISGVPSNFVRQVTTRRTAIHRVRNAEQLAAVLGLTPTIPEFQEMVRRLSFDQTALVVQAHGFANVGRATLQAEIEGVLRVSGTDVRVLQLAAR